MKTVFLGSVSRPDGYFGERRTVYLLYDPEDKKTIEVYPGGMHVSSVIPPCIDEHEALWMLNNHPAARKFYRQ